MQNIVLSASFSPTRVDKLSACYLYLYMPPKGDNGGSNNNVNDNIIDDTLKITATVDCSREDLQDGVQLYQ